MNLEEVRRFAWAQAEVYTNPNSRAYFSDLAIKHMSEMKLLLAGGRLNKHDKWENVYRHCLVQIAVMDITCDLLGIEGDDKDTLLTVAAVHDWKKRIDITQVDTNMDPEWMQRILKYYHAVSPDISLMSATGPNFIEVGLNGMSTKLQEVAFYVDDIVNEDMVVPVLDRLYLNKMKKGVKALDADHALTSRLGGLKYSDAEIKLATSIEQKFAAIIEKRSGLKLGNGESLPTVILEEMNKRINSFGKLSSK